MKEMSSTAQEFITRDHIRKDDSAWLTTIANDATVQEKFLVKVVATRTILLSAESTATVIVPAATAQENYLVPTATDEERSSNGQQLRNWSSLPTTRCPSRRFS